MVYIWWFLYTFLSILFCVVSSLISLDAPFFWYERKFSYTSCMEWFDGVRRKNVTKGSWFSAWDFFFFLSDAR